MKITVKYNLLAENLRVFVCVLLAPVVDLCVRSDAAKCAGKEDRQPCTVKNGLAHYYNVEKLLDAYKTKTHYSSCLLLTHVA